MFISLKGDLNFLYKARLSKGNHKTQKFSFCRGAKDSFFIHSPHLGNLEILSIEVIILLFKTVLFVYKGVGGGCVKGGFKCVSIDTCVNHCMRLTVMSQEWTCMFKCVNLSMCECV